MNKIDNMDVRLQLFAAKMQHSKGELKDTSALGKLRKMVARTKGAKSE
jgi:ribosomal protein L29